MRPFKKRDGFVLVAGVALAAILGILFSASFMRTQSQLAETMQRLESQEAFYAAETGVQRAILELRGSPKWMPVAGTASAVQDVPLRVKEDNPPSDPLGFYTVQVQPADDYRGFPSVWVRASGRNAIRPAGENATGEVPGTIQRFILARVLVINPAQFFLSTMGNLTVVSGAVYNSDILGKNVFFRLGENQPGITINGNVWYLSSVQGNTDPKVSIQGKTEKFPSVSFPGVDLDRFRGLAQEPGNSYHEGVGKLTISNSVDRASLGATDGLVFAEGDIYISGTIRQSMLIVSGGNIYIEGDLETGSSAAGRPQLGLFAKKDVHISKKAPDDISIEAFIVADGGVFMADSDGGQKNIKKNLKFNGAIAVRGGKDKKGNPLDTAVDLNVYQNREYIYNFELRDARSIPYLPFIANMVSWKEVASTQ